MTAQHAVLWAHLEHAETTLRRVLAALPVTPETMQLRLHVRLAARVVRTAKEALRP